jgi:twitching motility protein PilT
MVLIKRWTDLHVNELLKQCAAQEASDLHLKAMRPPLMRKEGKLYPTTGQPLSLQDIEALIMSILNEKQKAHLEEHLFVDFGYSLPGVSRFRATVFYQRSNLGAVFRRIPFDFPTLDDWGLPESIYDICKLPVGLVLVTGPTGSGKSSTLAAMIKEIIDKEPLHVVTIEDPIEFLFKDSVGSVTQREVGDDTRSFQQALRNTLRQDPDVIMVGEMRDAETIITAMTAAETGHLVLSTLHTNSASQSIDRIIDSFPSGQHRQIRIQLSQVLKGIISLKLLMRADQKGLIAAVEILRDNPKVTRLILEGNIGEIDEEMEKSVSYFKMQTMNQSLMALVLNKVITRETALLASTNPADLDRELRKFFFGKDKAPTEAEEVDQDGYSISEYMRMEEAPKGGELNMAEQFSDYSKIEELQEIKKLYEESLIKHGREMAEKDEGLERLKEDIRVKNDEIQNVKGQVQAAIQEREKIKQQLTFTKNDLEAKIQRLQERIQQLSAAVQPANPAPQAAEKSKGFFKK